jgi:hypothetical protein
MDDLRDIMNASAHVRQCYNLPQQIGSCDRAWINSAIMEALKGRQQITKAEAVEAVRAIMAKKYTGRNIMAAWKFASYEGANKEAGQVAILVGADPTVYLFPAGMAIIATTPAQH